MITKSTINKLKPTNIVRVERKTNIVEHDTNHT
jgi:hypothetical protein